MASTRFPGLVLEIKYIKHSKISKYSKCIKNNRVLSEPVTLLASGVSSVATSQQRCNLSMFTLCDSGEGVKLPPYVSGGEVRMAAIQLCYVPNTS